MNNVYWISFFLAPFIFINVVLAQDTLSTSRVDFTTDTIRKPIIQSRRQETDIVDVGRWILNKSREKRNDTSMVHSTKPHFSAVPAIGYTLQTGLAGVLSGNLAFHASNEKTQKLSSVLTSFNYTQYRQFIVPLQASIWTRGNKYNIVTDWRYMKYPSSTYGLGGNTKISDRYTIDFSYLKFHQTLFKSIAHDLYAGVGYYFDYFWDIRESVTSSTKETDLQRYSKGNKEIASSVALRLLYDSRLNQVNPDNGFVSNVVYMPNFTFMGSQSNWQTLLLEFRKFIRLTPKGRNVLALWSFNWLTLGGNPPYLLLPSTGWDDYFNTGRGYIQGRFRGKNMFYMEAEYRFDITRNGLLGGVLFGNAQAFFHDYTSELKNISPGYGGGLRIKLNKFSGTNFCIDYGLGAHGSRGFFVNLNEVF